MLRPALLNSFGIIEVTGKDCKSFLHNQFSNDINNLKPYEACYATYNTAQGRVIANFIVLSLQDYYWIIVKKDLIDLLIKKLKLFILRSEVFFQDQTENYSIVGNIIKPIDCSIEINPLPLKFNFQFDHRNTVLVNLPNNSQLSIVNNPLDNTRLADENQWDLFEIEQGFAWVSQKSSATCVAQMLNQEIMGAVNFKKGCYPGQEVIARSQYRGQVKRRPALFLTKIRPQIGDKLIDLNNIEIGIIMNTAIKQDLFACLAVVKITSVEDSYFLYHNEKCQLQFKRLFYQAKETV